MAINLMCTNSKCKHYYEDNCMKNLNEERLEIDENGMCVTFEKGINECYQMPEEKPKTNKSSYEIIQDFITENGYTYSVQNILDSYEKYWLQGYYTSYTMSHCIKNLEEAIKELRSH